MMRAMMVLALCAACVRPADERALLDFEVGVGAGDGVEVEVAGGQAAVREVGAAGASLWAQAPVLELRVASTEARAGWLLDVANCMPSAVLSLPDRTVEREPGSRPARCRFAVDLAAGEALTARLAPPDADVVEPFRVVVMGDIQTGMDDVHEVFERIDRVPGVRFVLSTGDVVEDAEPEEYQAFLAQVARLDVPFFSTIGNHELTQDPEQWHRLFGRYNVHFAFKGVSVTLLDSGNASLDPILYDRLDGWMEGAEAVHVFGTHYPPFDPIGVRSASFRSRKEAAKLLTRLAAGGVDATFYGHIHSYYAFENAGIPAYISGGGGAIPERFDGVGRHALSVDFDPAGAEARDRVVVGLVRVD